jgi:hypothetical protein
MRMTLRHFKAMNDSILFLGNERIVLSHQRQLAQWFKRERYAGGRPLAGRSRRTDVPVRIFLLPFFYPRGMIDAPLFSISWCRTLGSGKDASLPAHPPLKTGLERFPLIRLKPLRAGQWRQA